MDNAAEVQELRNKLRMMKLPSDEILNTVRKLQRATYKQKVANDTIRKEIAEFQSEIERINSSISSQKTNEEFVQLETAIKTYSTQLGILTADCKAAEARRQEMEDQVSKARSKIGGMYGSSKAKEEVAARLRTMENRLDKALVRYNQNLTKLAQMRVQIDQLRKEKSSFNQLIKTTLKEVDSKEQQINKLIRDSNNAYSMRDAKKMELVTLKQAQQEDIQAYEKNMKELDLRMEDEQYVETSDVPKQKAQPSIGSQSQVAQDRDGKALEAKTEEMQETINQTLSQTGFQTVEELFAEADRQEQENYSLFNYVMEHSAKKAKLEEEIAAIEMQEVELTKKAEEAEAQQENSIKELSETIVKTDEELKRLQEERAKSEEQFSTIYSEIEKLFNALGCSWDGVPDDKHTVTPYNTTFVLSSIEDVLGPLANDFYMKASLFYRGAGVIDEIKPSTTMSQKQVPEVQEKKIPELNKLMTIEDLLASGAI